MVYNLTRFAREKYDHFALRARLKSLGISLRSATEPIDDTSTGKLKAFLDEHSIDQTSYERRRDKLREELTLALRKQMKVW